MVIWRAFCMMVCVVVLICRFIHSRSYGNGNGYKIEQLLKYGQSLVSLWPVCSVWETTTLLYVRHWYTDIGQEEEKEEE